MEAVAIDNLSADVFADVLKNGAKRVKDTGCMIVPETFAQVVDEFTDWQVARRDLFGVSVRKNKKVPIGFFPIGAFLHSLRGVLLYGARVHAPEAGELFRRQPWAVLVVDNGVFVQLVQHF